MLLGSLPCFLSGLTARIWGRSAAQCPEGPGRGRLIPAAGDVLAEQGKSDRIGGFGRREKNHWGLHTRYNLPSRHPHKAPHWEGTLPVPGQQNPRGQGTSRFLSLLSFYFSSCSWWVQSPPVASGRGKVQGSPQPHEGHSALLVPGPPCISRIPFLPVWGQEFGRSYRIKGRMSELALCGQS